MKKTALGVFLMIMTGVAFADPICTNWGTMNVCVPFSSAEVAYGFAFLKDPDTGANTSENQLLLDTQIASISKLGFKFGASKGAHFAAAPFVSVDYALPHLIQNPVTAFDQFLADIEPGIYVGNSNLHADGWFWGVKSSKRIW